MDKIRMMLTENKIIAMIITITCILVVVSVSVIAGKNYAGKDVRTGWMEASATDATQKTAENKQEKTTKGSNANGGGIVNDKVTSVIETEQTKDLHQDETDTKKNAETKENNQAQTSDKKKENEKTSDHTKNDTTKGTDQTIQQTTKAQMPEQTDTDAK